MVYTLFGLFDDRSRGICLLVALMMDLKLELLDLNVALVCVLATRCHC